MLKTIICSVGTSASKKLGISLDTLESWVKDQSNIDSAAELMFKTFRDFKPNEDNLKDHLSAEIHSLVRIGIGSRDRIILLASETADGYCCALAVEKYLKVYWPDAEVILKKITGLQVDDAKRFRNIGVVEFVKQISHEVEAYGPENIILNPTGGFKALVPYTVLLGMLKGVKCDYIFERSSSLLELPPLPIEFNRSQFESYRDLFEKINRESSITADYWNERVPYNERNLLKPLIEESGEEITFSTIGFLFLEEMQNPSGFVPFLSRQAIDDCFDNLIHLVECNPFRFLQQVSRSKEAIQQKEHINMGNGLRWLKPGNTTDRYLVSIEGWRLLVWRAIREDEVGADYSTKIFVNLQKEPERERRKYSPFLRMDYVN